MRHDFWFYAPTLALSAVLAACSAEPSPADSSADASTNSTDSTTDTPTTSGPEGDGDPSTGDGDPSTGDGDPSTGDGDPSTGDGDGDDPIGDWTERDMARVFLSGHSLMDNPLPDFLELIAASLGKDFDWNQQNGIGSPIRVRTLGNSWDNLDWPGYRTGKNRVGQDMDVIAELADPMTLGPGERYDTLVITERHDILGTIQWEDTTGLLRHYHDRLIDGNSAGQTLFYHSWLDIDKAAPQLWIEHEKRTLMVWECVATKINLRLESEGRSDRLAVLPVGAALVELVERVLADELPSIQGTTQQKLDLLFNDNVHLTATGIYFAALVTHAAVFRGPVLGAAVPPGVDPAHAADFQALAWDFVRSYYLAPEPGVHTMQACREVIVEHVCASFWTILDNPGNIGGCQNHFGNADASNNPFRWPDPDETLWPAP